MVVHLPKKIKDEGLFNYIKKIIAGFEYQIIVLEKPRRYDCSILCLEQVDASLVYYIKDLLVKPRPILILRPSYLTVSNIAAAIKQNQKRFVRYRAFDDEDELVEIISDFFWKLESYLPGHLLSFSVSPEIEDYLTWLRLARGYKKSEFVKSLLSDRILKDKDYQQFLKEED